MHFDLGRVWTGHLVLNSSEHQTFAPLFIALFGVHGVCIGLDLMAVATLAREHVGWKGECVGRLYLLERYSIFFEVEQSRTKGGDNSVRSVFSLTGQTNKQTQIKKELYLGLDVYRECNQTPRNYRHNQPPGT